MSHSSSFRVPSLHPAWDTARRHSSQTRQAPRPSLAEIAHLNTRQHHPPTGQDSSVFKMQVKHLARCLAHSPCKKGRQEGDRDGQSEHSYPLPGPRGEALWNSPSLAPFSRTAVLEALARALGSHSSAHCQEQGSGRDEPLLRARGQAEQRVLSGGTPAPRSRPGGLAPALARPFPDLMRSHRKEQREPGLRLRGTVYLINCSFMIKLVTRRGQGAKDVGWVCREKLIPEFQDQPCHQDRAGTWPYLWTGLPK